MPSLEHCTQQVLCNVWMMGQRYLSSLQGDTDVVSWRTALLWGHQCGDADSTDATIKMCVSGTLCAP